MRDYLDDIERAPAEELGSMALSKLQRLVEVAIQGSAFYRRRLTGRPIESLADIRLLPVMTKHDLTPHLPPVSHEGLTGPMTGAYVFRSGGTTGDPKFAVYSADEFRRYVELFKRTYYAAGLRPGDRVANLFTCGSLYASFIFVNRMLEEMGCLNFPFTTGANADLVVDYIQRFNINVMVGFPSWLLEITARLEAAGVKEIRKIYYGGEHFYPEERRHLQESLGVQIIASGGYAAVDTGMMGYQCWATSGSVHHVHADHMILEIVHPATHEPLPDGEEGMLLVTNLDRHLAPVIRYEIGDMARILPEPCPCGRTTPLFELLRRGDDVLRIGYANVTYGEMLDALGTHPDLTSNMQMTKRRVNGKDDLTLVIEARLDATIFKGLARSLRHLVLKTKPDVGKMVDTGYVHNLTVEIVTFGSLPRMPVTGKIKRTIDLSFADGAAAALAADNAENHEAGT
ncbi:MAG: AMP-binding protein [Candidatus Sericytochromatia bacterium]|nr:AMP-binding protein [Candidatus Sericytochromatia bacterium]